MTVTGSLGGITEAARRAGPHTIVLDVANDLWHDDVGANTAATTALINGITGDSGATYGFDALETLVFGNVAQSVTDFQVTVTVVAMGTYTIGADEDVSVSAPAAAFEYYGGAAVAGDTALTISDLAPTVTVTGSITGGVSESDVRGTAYALVLTVANDLWHDNIGTVSTETTALINGITGDSASTYGWNAVKAFTDVHISQSVVDFETTINVIAMGTYTITADETVTVNVASTVFEYHGGAATAGDTTFVIGDVAASVTLSGTLESSNVDESDVRTGGPFTIVLVVENDYFTAGIDGSSGPSDDLVDGITAASSPVGGWDLENGLAAGSVTRNSDFQATVDVLSIGGYGIGGDEILTAVVPATALAGGSAATASPTITITDIATTISISGSFTTPTRSESDVRGNSYELVISVANDAFVTGVDGTASSPSDDVVAGITASTTTTAGWNSVHGLDGSAITRDSSTQLTLTIPALGDYAIPASETISVVVPVAALEYASSAVTAGTDVTVTDVAGTAAMSGTFTGVGDEADLRTNSFVLTITLSNDAFVSTIGGANAATTALVAGIAASSVSLGGWDYHKVVGTVTRVDAFTVDIDIGPVTPYGIGADEVIATTVPAVAIDGTVAIGASGSATVTDAATTVTVGGTLDGQSETTLRSGSFTIVLTLENDAFTAGVDGTNTPTTDLLAGIVSSLTFPNGFNAKNGLVAGDLVRDSDFQVTITVGPISDYAIGGGDDVLTVTVPASALASGGSAVGGSTITISDVTPSASVSGSLGGGRSEADVRANGYDIVVTLANDVFVTDVDGTNAATDTLLGAISAAASPAFGWNLQNGLVTGDLVRNSEFEVTITVDAMGSYTIGGGDEVVTVNVPSGVLESGATGFAATPAITISDLAPIATVSGSLTAGLSESLVRGNAYVLQIDIVNDAFSAGVDGVSTATDDLIGQLSASSISSFGWDNVHGIVAGDLTRVTDTRVTIAVGPLTTYAIGASETISVTIPVTALEYGVVALAANPSFSISNSPLSHAITGTLPTAVENLETFLNAGGATIVVTLANDAFVDTFGADNAITDAFIAALTSDGAEATGWNAAVLPKLNFTAIAVSADRTVATVTLPPVLEYDISVVENIAVTTPAAATYEGVSLGPEGPFPIDPYIPYGITALWLGGTNEADLAAGLLTLQITIQSDTFVGTLGDSDNPETLALLAGIVSMEPGMSHGWPVEVAPLLSSAHVTLQSPTVVEIDVPAVATYAISATEHINVTVPASAVTLGVPVAIPSPKPIGNVAPVISFGGTLTGASTEEDLSVTGGLVLDIFVAHDVVESTIVEADVLAGLQMFNGTGFDASGGAVTRINDHRVQVALVPMEAFSLSTDGMVLVSTPASLLESGVSVPLLFATSILDTPGVVTAIGDVTEADIVAGSASFTLVLKFDRWDSAAAAASALSHPLLGPVLGAPSVVVHNDTAVTVSPGAAADYVLMAENATSDAISVSYRGANATVAIANLAPVVTMSNTILSLNEADIVAGGGLITLTIANDRWVAADAAAIVASLTSTSSQPSGWNAVVVPLLTAGDVTFGSIREATVVLPSATGYVLSEDEDVVSSHPVLASPSGLISFQAGSVALSSSGIASEADIRTGGGSLHLAISGDFFNGTLAGDVVVSAVSSTSGQIEGELSAVDVTITGTAIDILLPPMPSYVLTADDTITISLPASASASVVPYVATGSVTVTSLTGILEATLDVADEAELVASGARLTLVLTNDAFVASVGTAASAEETALLDAITGPMLSSVLRPLASVTMVNASTVFVDYPPNAAYYLASADETVSVTAPAAVTLSGLDVAAAADPVIADVDPMLTVHGSTLVSEADFGGSSVHFSVALDRFAPGSITTDILTPGTIALAVGSETAALNAALSAGHVTEWNDTVVTITWPSPSPVILEDTDSDLDVHFPATSFSGSSSVDILAAVTITDSAPIAFVTSEPAPLTELAIQTGPSSLSIGVLHGRFDTGAPLAIVDAFAPNTSATFGWAATVYPFLGAGDVTFSNDTSATLDIPATPGYTIVFPEVFDVIVPVATPFTVPRAVSVEPVRRAQIVGGPVSVSESDVRTTGFGFQVTLVEALFQASVPSATILSGMTSSNSSLRAGWTALGTVSVVRDSDTVINVTVPALPGFAIGMAEYISIELAAGLFTAGSALSVVEMIAISDDAPAVTLGGSIVLASPNETTIVDGGAVLDVDIANDVWLAGVGTNAVLTDAVLDALVSTTHLATPGAWTPNVRPLVSVAHVVQVDPSRLRITFPAAAEYGILADETLHLDVPWFVTEGGLSTAASPDVTIANVAETVSLSVASIDESTLRASGLVLDVEIGFGAWTDETDADVLASFSTAVSPTVLGWNAVASPIASALGSVIHLDSQRVRVTIPPVENYHIGAPEVVQVNLANVAPVATFTVADEAAIVVSFAWVAGAAADEADVRAASAQLQIVIANDVWDPVAAPFEVDMVVPAAGDPSRQVGWAEVVPQSVSLVNATTVHVSIGAPSAYAIGSDQELAVDVAGASLLGGAPLGFDSLGAVFVADLPGSAILVDLVLVEDALVAAGGAVSVRLVNDVFTCSSVAMVASPPQENGWNVRVSPLPAGLSPLEANWTLSVDPAFAIVVDQVVNVTIPGACLEGALDVVAGPGEIVVFDVGAVLVDEDQIADAEVFDTLADVLRITLTRTVRENLTITPSGPGLVFSPTSATLLPADVPEANFTLQGTLVQPYVVNLELSGADNTTFVVPLTAEGRTLPHTAAFPTPPTVYATVNSTDLTLRLSRPVTNDLTVNLDAPSTVFMPSTLAFVAGQDEAVLKVRTALPGDVSVSVAYSGTDAWQYAGSAGTLAISPMQVTTPVFPPIVVSQTFVLTMSLTAAPNASLAVLAKSDGIVFSPSPLVFSTGERSKSFSVTGAVGGLFPVEFFLDGPDAPLYAVPANSSVGVGTTLCGNGLLEPTEACDDGNVISLDGCSSACQFEAGFDCTAGAPTNCTDISVCGDGVFEGTESCDDSNESSGDGCAGDCRSVETGYVCTSTSPSVCFPSTPRSTGSVNVTVPKFSTSVLVSWTVPDEPGASPIVAYYVYGRVVGEEEFQLLLDTSNGGDGGGQTQAVIDGLNATTAYEFEVRAVNSYGVGDASPVSVSVVTYTGCASDCFGHGTCRADRTCACNAGFIGDSCEATTCLNDCSMHGVCGANSTCACEPEWRGEDCSEPMPVCPDNCNGNGECIADGVCECGRGWRGETCAAGVNFEFVPITLSAADPFEVDLGSSETSEGGAMVLLAAKLGVQPTAPVTVPLAVSDRTEAKLSTDRLVYSSETWSILQTVTVTGVADDVRDGDVDYVVATGVLSSEDVLFDGLDADDAPLTNVDILWPEIISVSPLTCPQFGCEIEIRCENLQEGVRVYLDMRAQNVTHERIQGPDLTSDRSRGVFEPSVDVIRFSPGSSQNVGYASIFVVNPDRGHAEERRLYFANGCEAEGFFGEGTSCQSCPENAVCPGGDRVWAQDGFWVDPDNPGAVYECFPPEACQGGPDGGCGDGYEGYGCGGCSEGFFEQGDGCSECLPGKELYTTLIIVYAAYFGTLLMAILIAKDLVLSHVIGGLSSLQLLGGVGQVATFDLPPFLREAYSYLSLLTLDYSFLRSECSTLPSTFLDKYLSNLLVAAVVLGSVVMLTLLASVLVPAKRDFFRRRLVRGLLISLTLFYLTVTTRAFEMVFCVPRGDVNRLNADTTIVCNEGQHASLVYIAYVSLGLVTVAFPLSIGYIVFMQHGKELDERHSDFKAMFGYYYEACYPHKRLYGMVQFVLHLSLAVSRAFFSTFSLLRMLIGAIPMALACVTLLMWRPYEAQWKNVINFASNTVAIVASVVTYFSSTGISSSAVTGLSYFVLATAIALMLSWTLLYSWLAYLAITGSTGEPDASSEMGDFVVELDEDMGWNKETFADMDMDNIGGVFDTYLEETNPAQLTRQRSHARSQYEERVAKWREQDESSIVEDEDFMDTAVSTLRGLYYDAVGEEMSVEDVTVAEPTRLRATRSTGAILGHHAQVVRSTQSSSNLPVPPASPARQRVGPVRSDSSIQLEIEPMDEEGEEAFTDALYRAGTNLAGMFSGFIDADEVSARADDLRLSEEERVSDAELPSDADKDGAFSDQSE